MVKEVKYEPHREEFREVVTRPYASGSRKCCHLMFRNLPTSLSYLTTAIDNITISLCSLGGLGEGGGATQFSLMSMSLFVFIMYFPKFCSVLFQTLLYEREIGEEQLSMTFHEISEKHI